MQSPAGVAIPQSPVTHQVASTPGTGLELTLDSQLQYESEQALAKAIETSNADQRHRHRHGREDRPDPLHGEPHRDPPVGARRAPRPLTPSDPGGVVPIGPNDAVNEAQSNLAVTQLYEPGSVFKLVTFSAALQDGLINPNSVFTVPDQISLDGSTFHDAEPHPTEQLSATQILAQSSNIGTSD